MVDCLLPPRAIGHLYSKKAVIALHRLLHPCPALVRNPIYQPSFRR